jgi:hypothetical protein
VSELMEQLREQAAELREEGKWLTRPIKGKRQIVITYGQHLLSLADLIDGMLGRHRPGGGSIGSVCMQDGTSMPCADLVDLASHVSDVLSDYTQTAHERG